MGEWLSKMLRQMAGAIVVIAVLAWLMRVVYDLLAPAIPFLLGLAFFLLLVILVIRHRRDW